jgi:hypothetical protein
MKKGTNTLAAAMVLLLFTGCPAEQPDDILDKETFAKVYAAMVENERLSGPQSLYNVRQYDSDTTLSRLGVTREQIERTVAYYDQDLRRWHEFYIEAMRAVENDPRARKK